MSTLNPTVPSLLLAQELEVVISNKPLPLVLLPVRLETRFFSLPNNEVELRVRIYPDRIHINSHESALTVDELIWGKHFWNQIWQAGQDKLLRDEQRRKAAWQQLAERFEAPRAAFVAESLRPINFDDDCPKGPVPDGTTPPKLPSFPGGQAKDRAWTSPAFVDALPTSWTVVGYKDEAVVVKADSNPVTAKLQAGPNPNAPEAAISPDQIALESEMKWMVEFDEAERVGMAVRFTMSKTVADKGFDFLLVTGIRKTSDPLESTTILKNLLNAHHYTDGLSFIQPGTPSNNTEDTPAGFSSKDAGYETSYAAEFDAPKLTPEERKFSNTEVLSHAFGFVGGHKAVFDKIPNAFHKEQLESKNMNDALWEATWGYLLLQMLGVGRAGESPLTDADIDWAHQHFVEHVRASGPLPTLRVGKQPYGVLPVTSLRELQPLSTTDAALKNFLLKLREVWRRNLDNAPRLGRSFDDEGQVDVDKDFAEVLSMDGLSSSYSIRHLMGRQFTQNYWSFLGEDIEAHGFWPKHQEMTSAVLRTMGVPWRPRLSHAVYSPLPVKIEGPLVQRGPQKFGDSLKPNYIDLLLQIPKVSDVLVHPGHPGTSEPTLLYLLLQHSLMLEYVQAATQLLIKKNLMNPGDRRELEMIEFDGHPSRIAMDPIFKPIKFTPGITTVEDVLLGIATDADAAPMLQRLDTFRATMKQLGSLRPDRLEQLMAGTLDLCSHRLDAWITSVATKHLTAMRNQVQTQTDKLIGGYGWVMDLKPNPTGMPSAEEHPVFQPLDNPGFLQAPSLAQASAAALLRSGHLTHASKQDDNPFEIDLTSERVRLAKWLLDGVRQGQPLGALLGYRFERRLQEANKAQFISDFREIAPLVANKIENPQGPMENIAANNVVDGLVLSRRWQALPKPSNTNDTSRLTVILPALQSSISDRKLLEAELDALTDSVDAVADALLTESVYQVVRGNPLRASDTLESVAGGESPPPELEVARTPRTGIALTHRVVALFSGSAAMPSHWSNIDHPDRANAEPHLNAWAAKLLGNPFKVRCSVDRLDPETGDIVDTGELSLDELHLAPLDFIYAGEGGENGLEEIERRILLAITQIPEGFPAGSRLQIRPGRSAEWEPTDLSYTEFKEVVRTARKLLNGVRAIGADDLTLPHQINPSTDDPNGDPELKELVDRADAASKSLDKTLEELNELTAFSTVSDIEQFQKLMLRSAAFGVSKAIPHHTLSATSDRMVLLMQAFDAMREFSQRKHQLKTLPPSGPSADAQRQHAIARLQIIFGKSFVVLPRFKATNGNHLQQALEQSTSIQEGDPFASVTWFLRMARVRDGVSRLDAALSNAEAIGAVEKLNLSVAQLPLAQNNEENRWVGLPLKSGQSMPAGKLSLVVQSSETITPSDQLAGVLIDEFVEVLPNSSETTGISFQYDQPNAAPPQAILIAVPPDINERWTTRSLHQVLLETLDLARLRAVDPDALGEVGHYLPALYFAHNVNPFHAVSTDFSKLKVREA
jgi:hypothetical protein